MAASRSSFAQFFAKPATIWVKEHLENKQGVNQDNFEKIFDGLPEYPYAAPLIHSLSQAMQDHRLDVWCELACGKMTDDLFNEDGNLKSDIEALFNQQNKFGRPILTSLINAMAITEGRESAKQTINTWIAKAYLLKFFIEPAIKNIADPKERKSIKDQLQRLMLDEIENEKINRASIRSVKNNYKEAAKTHPDYLTQDKKEISSLIIDSDSESDLDSDTSSPEVEELPVMLKYLLFNKTPAFFKFVDFNADPTDEASLPNPMLDPYRQQGWRILQDPNHKQASLLNDLNRTHWLNGKRYLNSDTDQLKIVVEKEFKGHFNESEKFYTQDVSAPPLQQLLARGEAGTSYFSAKRISALTSTDNADHIRVILYDIKFTEFDANTGDNKEPKSIPGYVIFDCELELKRANDPHFKPEGYKFVREAASNPDLLQLITQSGIITEISNEQIRRMKVVENDNWDKFADIVLAADKQQIQEKTIPTAKLSDIISVPVDIKTSQEDFHEDTQKEISDSVVDNLLGGKDSFEDNLRMQEPILRQEQEEAVFEGEKRETPNFFQRHWGVIAGYTAIAVLTAATIAACIFIPPVGAALGAATAYVAGTVLGISVGAMAAATLAAVGAAVVGALATAFLSIGVGIRALVNKTKAPKEEGPAPMPMPSFLNASSDEQITKELSKNPSPKSSPDISRTASTESLPKEEGTPPTNRRRSVSFNFAGKKQAPESSSPVKNKMPGKRHSQDE